MKRLGEVATLQRGFDLPVQDRQEGPIPIFAANGSVGTHSEHKVQGPGVVTGRSGSIGKVHYVEENYWPLNTALWVKDFHDNDPRWVSRLLTWMHLEQFTRGVGVPTLNRNLVHEVKIPLPPLEEQKRIAAILDQADALRRLRTRALEKLNTLGQAIFHEMFGDTRTNPKGWDQVRLGELCDVGSSKRVFVSEFVREGVPFYRGTEVGQLALGNKIVPELFISKDHYTNLINQAGRPAIGDLLLPSICHDGRIWRVNNDSPFYFKDGRVLWIRVSDGLADSDYLRGHLKSAFLSSYNSIASGTTFAELKIVNLKKMRVLNPPMHLQLHYATQMAELEMQRFNFVRSVDEANTLFTSLQHRAFRGQL
jgi:type I restriction enzyme S subunit